MINPKVSIIIPTYNRSKYVTKAIESALMQDYSNLEVIVSDNASTDDTPKVVEKYLNDARFKYFRNEKNLGFVLNWRNALYNHSSGEWILILHDDDYLIKSSYVSKAIKLVCTHRNISLVHANYIIEYENSGKIEKSNFAIPEHIDGQNYFLHYREKGFPHIHSTLTVLFNRSKALKVGAFGRDILNADTSLWLRLMLYGDIGFIEDHVAVYRVHQGNESFNIMDVKRDVESINDLKSIYYLAQQCQLRANDLNRWLERELRAIFLWRFMIYLKNKEKKIAWNLFKEYFKRYPKIIKLFLKPKNLLVFAATSNEKLVNIYKKIKSFFRKKSY